jgi:uncharacterized protein YjbI with pentapeptide repeats
VRELQGIGWEISSTSVMYADLRGVSFAGKHLKELDLSEANLDGVDFSGTTFEGCRLQRASWTGASFEGADLRGADLGPLEDAASIAALRGAIISEAQARSLANALGLQVIS